MVNQLVDHHVTPKWLMYFNNLLIYVEKNNVNVFHLLYIY